MRPAPASSTRSSIFPRSSFCALTTLLPITVFFAGTISVYLAALGSAILFSSCQRKLLTSRYFLRRLQHKKDKDGNLFTSRHIRVFDGLSHVSKVARAAMERGCNRCHIAPRKS